MSQLLHVCLYNTEMEVSEDLCAHIEDLNHVRLVAEVDNTDALAGLLHAGAVNLIFFHLDPDPTEIVPVIEEVATHCPDVAMIAISHQSDPAAIIAPMRAGCEQFVCEPIDVDDLAGAVHRVASRRFLAGGRSKCISVVGASGGAGATSIACNLALELGHSTDRHCLLMDLNLQFGDAAMNFDCQPQYSIADLAVDDMIDRAMLSSVVVELPCKVALLSRPPTMEQAENVTDDTIRRALEAVGGQYENVVIDLPRHLDPRALAAVSRSDLVLIVCQLLVPSIRNARRYYEALVSLGVPEERIEFVINRSGGRTDRLGTQDVEEVTQKAMFASVPNDYQFVARSIDLGRPIAALDRNNAVRAAIRNIAAQILGESGDGQKRGRGFFSRLLSK